MLPGHRKKFYYILQYIIDLKKQDVTLFFVTLQCYNVTFYSTRVRHFCDISKKIHDNLSYYLDLSGHKWTEVDNDLGNCRTFASSIRNDKQTGQNLLLSGGGFSARRSSKRPPKQRSTAEGKVNPL